LTFEHDLKAMLNKQQLLHQLICNLKDQLAVCKTLFASKDKEIMLLNTKLVDVIFSFVSSVLILILI